MKKCSRRPAMCQAAAPAVRASTAEVVFGWKLAPTGRPPDERLSPAGSRYADLPQPPTSPSSPPPPPPPPPPPRPPPQAAAPAPPPPVDRFVATAAPAPPAPQASS